MLSRFNTYSREPTDCEAGFTLIELLVVIIIIGILAAIAIPVFLNQREKGYDAQAKSDLRNLANFEEVYLTDTGSYGPSAAISSLEGTLHHSPNDSLRVVSYTSNQGYCLSATSNSGQVWFYDSEAGGLLPRGTAACPTTYVTTDGTNIP